MRYDVRTLIVFVSTLVKAAGAASAASAFPLFGGGHLFITTKKEEGKKIEEAYVLTDVRGRKKKLRYLLFNTISIAG